MPSFWNEIYSHFDPVAFSAFGLSLHWYGIAYAISLILALFIGKYFIKKSPHFFTMKESVLDNYFIVAEIGVILGARIGYILIYDSNSLFYLTHPWQIFNPFNQNGDFVGISGMSYHGGVVGLVIASSIFAKVKKLKNLMILDLLALSVPLAYIFGRVGNFLNQELYGREINNRALDFIGIIVHGKLVYPSQLIEAFLEGLVVFGVVFLVYKKLVLESSPKSAPRYGILILVYVIAYSLARFVAEFFREPDSQLGLYALGLSMGQILSIIMALAGLVIVYATRRQSAK